MHSRCSALSLVLFSLFFYFSFSLSFASFLTSIFAPRMLPATCLEIGVAWAVPCASQRVCACVCVRLCVCVYIFMFAQIWLAYNNVVAAVVVAAVAVASWRRRRRRRRLLTFCVGILTQLITAPPSDRTRIVYVCAWCGLWQGWATTTTTADGNIYANGALRKPRADQAAAKSFSFIFGMCTIHTQTHTQHTHCHLFMLINCIAQFMHFIWIICIAIVNCKCDMQAEQDEQETKGE